MRQNGLRQLVIYDISPGTDDLPVGIANERSITFPEEAYYLAGRGGEYKYVHARF